MEADKGVLTFRKAFNTMERRFAEQAGTAIGKRPTIQQASSLPGFLQKKLYNFMQVCYQNRDNDEDMQTFLDWYIGLILERWTSTGPDYNQWVHFLSLIHI